MTESDSDNDIDDYNGPPDSEDAEQGPEMDPDYFMYDMMKLKVAEEFLNRTVEMLCTEVNGLHPKEQKLSPTHAEIVLQKNNWDVKKSITYYHQHNAGFARKLDKAECLICLECAERMGTSCGHAFCFDCWSMYLTSRIKSGESTGIECMENGCDEIVPTDIVGDVITDSEVLDTYRNHCLKDHITCHPQLMFCPGKDCEMVVHAFQPSENRPQRVHCKACDSTFCFTCGQDYHAPLECVNYRS